MTTVTHWIKNTATDFLPILIGASLILAFAPFDLFPFALFSPIAMLALTFNDTGKRAFFKGWLFGLGMFSAGVYWLYISVHQYGNVPMIPALLIVSALILFLALYPACVYGATARLFKINNASKIVFAFPAIWVFSEWARTYILSGFPWLYLGYSQVSTPLAGYAPILGVYGVSFAALLSGSLILNAIIKIRGNHYLHAALCLFLSLSIWIGGTLLSFLSWTAPSHESLTVSLVQGNIPQSIKWSPDHINLSYKRYQDLTKPLWGKSDLIIWPEAAIPVPLQDNLVFLDKLDKQAIKTHSNLIMGIPVEAATGDGYYNSLISVGKNKNIYNKRLLVPFGEYTPYRMLFKKISEYLDIPMSNLLPGEMYQAPFMIGQIRILPAICFEVGFAELMNAEEPDVGLLLVVTNDAWFGKSTAQAQHFEIARMRALELRRPAIFVSNNGITGVINADGTIAETIKAHVPAVLTTRVQARQGLTPWMIYGTNPILGLVLLCFFVALKLRHRHPEERFLRRRNTSTDPSRV